MSAVSVAIFQSTRMLIAKNDILNQLAQWLKKLEQAENVHRMKDQFFYVSDCDEKVFIKHS